MAGVVIGWRIEVPGGIAPAIAVAFGLTLAWALVGIVDTGARERERTKAITVPSARRDRRPGGRRRAGGGPQGRVCCTRSSGARDVATLAALVVTAISFHFLLALPDGRLHDSGRRVLAVGGYVVAIAVGLVFVLDHRPFSLADGAISWVDRGRPGDRSDAQPLHRIHRPPPRADGVVRHRGLPRGHGRARGDRAPSPGGLAGAARRRRCGGNGARPARTVGRGEQEWGPHASRGLVQVLAVFGFVVVVSAIYLVVVLGLGHAPKTTGDKEVLALSMIASGVAALIFVPVRARFLDSATRFVYGSREAPDEVLRTFGSRLTRAIPMDELLLQLAESLRKTMSLISAEVYAGTGEVLERTASVPDLGPGIAGRLAPGAPGRDPGRASRGPPGPPSGSRLCCGAAKRSRSGLLPSATRASCWASSSSSDRRWPAPSPRTTTGCWPTWPGRSGWPLHNSQLDTALQTTLDEVRKQADALRESRARIVASGDAERRRVERNLHDGAQQHLVALAVNLRLAKDIIVDDQEAGMEMLDQLAGEVQETIQELRELAHGIYPPLLVDSGLVEALRAAANRNPLPVDIVADGIGRYPSETEAAIYFCCLEALQNAAKHAPDCAGRGPPVGGVRWPAVHSDRRRPGFRSGHCAARSRLRQHG